MNPFLYDTAKEILSKYKNDIQSYCFVFPNKRTKFFFRKYYADIYGESHKAPDMREIKNLVQDYTGLTEIDNLSLNFILYKVFKEVDKKNEYSFDTFYRLGEIILSDFNEIDNWLIDAKQIFQNIKDIKEIDAHFDWLTEEQKEVLKSFWINFSVENYSDEQKMFIELWNILPKIYQKFTETLLLQGIAYSGLKNRELSKLIDNADLPEKKYKKYLFIGFNALNKAETKLLKYFRKNNKAEFYWDTDEYYQNDEKQEAGDFLRKNFEDLYLPNKDLPNNFLKEKQIDLIGVPLDIGQTKILPQIIKNHNAKDNAAETAIVLADEHLLFPTLSSLPEEIEVINVTMGYPFKLTTLFGLIKQFVNLHVSAQSSGSSSFFHKNIIDILRHPFIMDLEMEIATEIISEIEEKNMIYVSSKFLISKKSELLKLLFTNIPKENALDIFLSNVLNILFILFNKEKDQEGKLLQNFENEYVHRAYVKTKQLREIFRENDVPVSVKLGAELLMQILRTEQIPFEGNAVKGIQVMGVLESRNLDFKNVIIIGMNEGKMPSVSKSPTFISQSMRFAFNMPMIKYQDAVYAYLFYSLIQRAEKVSLIYNSLVNNSNAGELSRFILQVKNETNFKINEYQFNQSLVLKNNEAIFIDKSEEVLKILENYFIEGNKKYRKLSASAINSYLDCSLQFYYKYIASFKEASAVEEEFSPSAFGSILHKALEEIYEDIGSSKSDRIVEKSDIQKIYPKTEQYVENAFKTIFSRNDNYKVTGSQIIVKNVIVKYVNIVLKKDEEYAPFEITSVEDKDNHSTELEINTYKGNKKVSVFGIIDRVDKKDGIYRVIDYKTGQQKNTFNSIEDLFKTEKNNRAKHVLQTFIYAMIFKDSQAPTHVKMSPSIFYVRNMKSNNYSDSIFLKPAKGVNIKIDENKTEELLPEFIDRMKSLFEEIFNPETPFSQTENKKNCEYCPFYDLCY